MIPSAQTSASSILALALVASAVASAPASADFKSIDIDKITSQFDDKPTIKLKDSGNGYVLDEYRQASIKMRLKAKVVVTYIADATARLNDRPVWALPLGHSTRQIDESVTAQVLAADLATYLPGAITHCNSFAQVGKTEKSLIQIPVRFEATQDTGGSRSAVETFDGFVVCAPRKENLGQDDLTGAAVDFKVKGIAIRLLTSAGKPSSPNPGTQCQTTTARVRVETSKPGAVRFRLWTKIGDEPATAQVVDAWASFKGPGKYEAVFDKKIDVTRSSPVQVKAEELVNPIGFSTAWKLANLDCDGAGGGGLATPGDSATPSGGPAQPAPAVSGNISLGTKPGGGPTKPREALVSFRLWTNKPGPTSYKLTCSGGHEWNGTVPTVRVAPGKFRAHGMYVVPIVTTTRLACALRSTSIAGAPLAAIASKEYLVVSRNPALDGPKGVAAKPQSTHGAQRHVEDASAPLVPRPRPAVRMEARKAGD